MAQIQTSVEVAAPAELVFAFFVPQRMPYWYGADMDAHFEVQGGAADFAVSQKVRISGRLGKCEVSHTAVVTAVQPARVFEWRFKDRYGVEGTERWELQRPEAAPSAASSGNAQKTIVRMTSAYTMTGLLGKLMDRLVTQHAVARRNQDYLARLKRYAEHGDPE
jgi:uncharacterized membrane protein